jgi:putative salt-induced outer membrane protein YdiY
MIRIARMAAAVALATAATLTWAVNTHAQDAEKELGWFFTGELTAVWAAGNSQSNTFGLASSLRYLWERAQVKFEAGGVRAESSLTTRTAVGTSPDDFRLEEATVTRKTAEAYYARGRYDYSVSSRFFVFGGADWLRNTFAGIDSRFLVAAGAGNTWLDTDRTRFKTDYSATYTFQEDVVDNPFLKRNFAGARFTYDFWSELTSTADFTSVLTADWNLDNTDDIRLDLTNALSIAISSALALKPSLQLLWRNDPALTEVALVESDGTPTGETVLVALDKLDSFFTLALVVKL